MKGGLVASYPKMVHSLSHPFSQIIETAKTDPKPQRPPERFKLLVIHSKMLT